MNLFQAETLLMLKLCLCWLDRVVSVPVIARGVCCVGGVDDSRAVGDGTVIEG